MSTDPQEPIAAVAVTRPPLRPDQSVSARIWRDFRRHRIAVAALIVIVLLFGFSLLAPVLASNQPLYYYGFNRAEYLDLTRTARNLMGRLDEATDLSSRADAVAVVNRLLADVQSRLPPEPAASLAQLSAEFQQIVSRETLTDADLKPLQDRLRREFGSNTITLQPKAHSPALASMAYYDAGWLSLYFLTLAAPLWRPLTRRCVGDEWFARLSPVILIGLPVLAAVTWAAFVPMRVDRTDYKQGRFAADPAAEKAPVVYQSVVWAIIPYAIDEDDLDAKGLEPYVVTLVRPLFDRLGSVGKQVVNFVGRERPATTAGNTSATAAAKPWQQPHWLGTDEIGRDLACRMLWGGRVSLTVGIVAVAIYTVIGVIVGALAGYFRGLVDLIVSRIIEVVICFPAFFLILTIIAFVGPSLLNIMIVIGLTGWTGVARLVRGEFLRLVDLEFVQAGRVLGYGPLRIIFRHVLPNAMAPVLVSATFGIAGAILTESALSFLGLGISVPTPSWGSILSSGRDAMFRAPWIIQLPGLAIFVTITCYNLVGETLRDAADPRLRGSR